MLCKYAYPTHQQQNIIYNTVVNIIKLLNTIN